MVVDNLFHLETYQMKRQVHVHHNLLKTLLKCRFNRFLLEPFLRSHLGPDAVTSRCLHVCNIFDFGTFFIIVRIKHNVSNFLAILYLFWKPSLRPSRVRVIVQCAGMMLMVKENGRTPQKFLASDLFTTNSFINQVGIEPRPPWSKAERLTTPPRANFERTL